MSHPSAIRNLLRRPLADWALLGEALARLLLAKLRLLTLPFARIATDLGIQQAETLRTLDARVETLPLLRRISWAVSTGSRYVPLGLVCLPQAMAAQHMLRRRGLPSTLYLGVKSGVDLSLTAHAWLRTGSVIVTGKKAQPGHVTVACFAETASRRWRFPLAWIVGGGVSLALATLTLLPVPPLRDSQFRTRPEWQQEVIFWIAHNDFALNFGGFAGVSLALHLSCFGWHRAAWPYRVRSAGLFLTGMWLLELSQFFMPERHVDPLDLWAAFLAVTLTTLLWTKLSIRARSPLAKATVNTPPSTSN